MKVLASDEQQANSSNNEWKELEKQDASKRRDHIAMQIDEPAQTIRFAAEPRRVKLPATVLTLANMSHAVFSSAEDIPAADAATLAPSKRTAENKGNYIPRFLGPKITNFSAIQR